MEGTRLTGMSGVLTLQPHQVRHLGQYPSLALAEPSLAEHPLIVPEVAPLDERAVADVEDGAGRISYESSESVSTRLRELSYCTISPGRTGE